jgi:hypothetical protein
VLKLSSLTWLALAFSSALSSSGCSFVLPDPNAYDAELKRCVDLSRSFEEYERCANDVDRRYR